MAEREKETKRGGSGSTLDIDTKKSRFKRLTPMVRPKMGCTRRIAEESVVCAHRTGKQLPLGAGDN